VSADEKAPEPVDTSHLTDADWAEISRLRRTWETGGTKAMLKAMKDLAEADPIRYIHVVAAYFPETVRETIKDAMAEKGMTDDDLRKLIRKLESPTRDQQDR
jgi:hypothetical protein